MEKFHSRLNQWLTTVALLMFIGVLIPITLTAAVNAPKISNVLVNAITHISKAL